MPGFNKNLRESPVKTIGSIVTVLAAIFALIWGVNTHLVFTKDLTAAKNEIISEVKSESGKIRSVYLHDLQARLEDVEVEIDELLEAKKDVPTSLRRSTRRLTNRIKEIGGDQ